MLRLNKTNNYAFDHTDFGDQPGHPLTASTADKKSATSKLFEVMTITCIHVYLDYFDKIITYLYILCGFRVAGQHICFAT